MPSKNNKNKFWKGFLVGSLVSAFLAICLVGLSAGIMMIARNVSNPSQNTEQQASEQSMQFRRMNQKMQYMQKIIDNYFYFEEDIDPAELEKGAYSGMVYGLKDPYAAYFTKEDMETVMEDSSGVYCGIGAAVNQNLQTGVITILRVYSGSPAEEAGLIAGDKIYKVDGVEVTGMDLDIMVQQHVRGAEGTSVEIEVYRESVEDYVVTTPVRRQVEHPTVEYEMMEDKIGYILVTSFENITIKQFRDAVNDLESQGMERMIIDLRNNPGGTLEAAVGTISYIVPDGVLIYDTDKNGAGMKFISENGHVSRISYTSENPEVEKQTVMEDTHEMDLPIVILINENSASAAEAFTSALRDFDKATIVGTNSFGKGIMQTILSLGDGSALKLTTAHFYTKSGYDIHKQGIKPDVEVELSEELIKKGIFTKEEDNQLQKAIEVVKGLK